MHEQKPESEAVLGRRAWLARMSATIASLGAVVVGVPTIGFLLGPLFQRVGRKWRVVADATTFAVGATMRVEFEDASPLPWSGSVAHTAAWLRRESSKRFVAFSVNCTHLGCPVRWLNDASLFLCPCHGGVYYADGEVAAGPPLRALPRYPVRVRGSQVEILTSPVPID